MNYSLQTIIQCPFFVSETKNLICCEGFVTKTCMTTAFCTRENKIEYIKEHCVKVDGGTCHLAMSLFEKYQKLHEEEDRLERLRYLEHMLTLNHNLSLCDKL